MGSYHLYNIHICNDDEECDRASPNVVNLPTRSASHMSVNVEGLAFFAVCHQSLTKNREYKIWVRFSENDDTIETVGNHMISGQKLTIRRRLNETASLRLPKKELLRHRMFIYNFLVVRTKTQKSIDNKKDEGGQTPKYNCLATLAHTHTTHSQFACAHIKKIHSWTLANEEKKGVQGAGQLMNAVSSWQKNGFTAHHIHISL